LETFNASWTRAMAITLPDIDRHLCLLAERACPRCIDVRQSLRQREAALRRYGLARFLRDWDALLADVAG
jgi:hypothetical protein